MITRSIDYRKLQLLLAANPHVAAGTDAKTWISNPCNILLKDGNDYAMFEQHGFKFAVHLLFNSKGAKARDTLIKMVGHIFSTFGASCIFCAVPKTNRKMQLFLRMFFGLKPLKEFLEVEDNTTHTIFAISEIEFMTKYGDKNG